MIATDGGGCGSPATRQKSIAEACKAAGASALERVAAAETEAGPKYKQEIVRDGSGQVVEVRQRLDLGVGRYGAQDHLKDMWRADQTKAVNTLIMALLFIAQQQGSQGAWAARYASWLAQITPSMEAADVGSIKAGLAGAMFGGRVDSI
jgi:hypothetical protein